MRVRRRAAVLVVCALALVVAACATDDGADEGGGSASGGDLGATVGDGPGEDEQRPGSPVVAYDELVPASIDDIQAFWDRSLPEVFGVEYEPIAASDIHPYAEDDLPPPCGGEQLTYDEIADNAFWCSIEDYLAFDDQGLFPTLYRDYGPFAIAMVLAHEWGHAVQDQVGFEAETIRMEQQADCFAGSWTADVLERSPEELGVRIADLEVALGGMLAFRDAPGTPVDDPSAHGSGFDRINAFQEGFELGPGRCFDYDTAPPTVVELQFLDEADLASGGNLPYDDAVDLAALDLNDWWVELNADFQPVEVIIPFDPETEQVPACGGTAMSAEEALYTIRFCFEEGYVIWDDVMLRTVHADIGDFGVATLLGETWTEAAQKQLGGDEAFIASRTGKLQQACFTGAWAGRLTVPDASPHIGGLSPGDLDEAVQAFLAFSETPDQRGQTTTGSAFERAQAFRIGFFDGVETCDAMGG